MDKGKKFLSDLKLYSDYLKWRGDRYENWDEACEDIINGHKKHFNNKELNSKLDDVLKSMQGKRVLASQRSLQYRNEQIERSNSRLYNCSSTYCAYNKVFQNSFNLALNGCGVGGGLLLPFVDRISEIRKPTGDPILWTIPDTIEGWSDSLGVLLSSYFVDKQPFPQVANRQINFDYSEIRPKGSKISGGFKAPGPDGLRASLEIIKAELDRWIDKEGSKMRSILVSDIICHASDAVLSGGIRRAALNFIVDPNDEEMINAKSGNWWDTHPHRARSNNSVLLLRSEVTQNEFEELVKLNEGLSDIGFVFADSWFDMFNPCFTGDMKLLTSEGYKRFDELDLTKHHTLINLAGQEVEGKIKQTGVKPTVEISFTTGKKIRSTEDHRFMLLSGEEEIAKNLKGKQVRPYINKHYELDDEYVKFGFMQGDASLTRLSSESHQGLEVHFNQKDQEVANLFDVECIKSCYINGYNDKLLNLGFSSNTLPSRVLPTTINNWSDKEIKSFLRGLYSANGSVLKAGRVTLKTSCKELAEKTIELLSRLNITSYYTTNKAKVVSFSNGDYECKESYDVNIAKYESILDFYNTIGFIHSYKMDKLEEVLLQKAPKVRSVKTTNKLETVYDFELDDLTHWGVVENVIAHNCFEIAKIPMLVPEGVDLTKIKYNEISSFLDKLEAKKEALGVAFCNLSEINAELAKTKEEFLKECKNASILGTVQAGYTSFPYLGKTTEEIVRREALIGVSITGWMNNQMLFDPELLKEGARIVKETNKEIAKLIGINQAARTCCVKPSGNASVILGTASGIHPEHSEMYFRIMQLNKETETAKYLEKHMPFLLEESVNSKNNTDYVVFIPIVNDPNGLFKSDMKGVKHLEKIKLVQQYWVNEGTNKDLCVHPKINHNCSNTIIVDDLEAVTKYIWDNKEEFTACSFISDYGDKDFVQAPFTTVTKFDDIVSKYGKGSLFISGLIIDGLHYFNQDLWKACEVVEKKDIKLVGTREQVVLQKYWISRVKKISNNYFGGDKVKTIHCIKDVHLLHKWEGINRQMKYVDFSKILNEPTFKEIGNYGAQACSGVGGCEITRLNG